MHCSTTCHSFSALHLELVHPGDPGLALGLALILKLVHPGDPGLALILELGKMVIPRLLSSGSQLAFRRLIVGWIKMVVPTLTALRSNAATHLAGNLRPSPSSGSVLADQIGELGILLLAPIALLDGWIKSIVPTLTALPNSADSDCEF